MPKYALPQKCLFLLGTGSGPHPGLLRGSVGPTRPHPERHLDRFSRDQLDHSYWGLTMALGGFHLRGLILPPFVLAAVS